MLYNDGTYRDQHFHPRTWGGRTYYSYVPRYYYYGPTICGTFYTTGYWGWLTFTYSWNWIHPNFWGWYGYYYRPYDAYASPSYWLTDYVIVTNLYSPYYERYPYRDYGEGYRDGYSDGYQDAVISEAEKNQIRRQIEDELREDSELQKNEESNRDPSSVFDKFNDPDYLFVVADSLSLEVVGSGAEFCELTPGDLIRTAERPREGDLTVKIRVVSAKSGKGHCKAGTEAYLSVDHLQYLYNGFSESIERGMEKLEKDRGDLSFSE